MKPIFTIHEGEYLVGSYIEEEFNDLHVWVPSKDIGVDLLVTDALNKKIVSLQVKFSKNYLETHAPYSSKSHQENLTTCGWYKLYNNSIARSKADFWVFILRSSDQRNMKNMQYLIIESYMLLKRLKKVYGEKNIYWLYFWVTKRGKCWDTRDLKKKDLSMIMTHEYHSETRDFTVFLNRWELIKEKLS
jgi:hypothetical protein